MTVGVAFGYTGPLPKELIDERLRKRRTQQRASTALAALDVSGKGAEAGTAFFMIGAAIVPAVGGGLIGNAGFAMLGITVRLQRPVR